MSKVLSLEEEMGVSHCLWMKCCRHPVLDAEPWLARAGRLKPSLETTWRRQCDQAEPAIRALASECRYWRGDVPWDSLFSLLELLYKGQQHSAQSFEGN